MKILLSVLTFVVLIPASTPTPSPSPRYPTGRTSTGSTQRTATLYEFLDSSDTGLYSSLVDIINEYYTGYEPVKAKDVFTLPMSVVDTSPTIKYNSDYVSVQPGVDIELGPFHELNGGHLRKYDQHKHFEVHFEILLPDKVELTDEEFEELSFVIVCKSSDMIVKDRVFKRKPDYFEWYMVQSVFDQEKLTDDCIYYLRLPTISQGEPGTKYKIRYGYWYRGYWNMGMLPEVINFGQVPFAFDHDGNKIDITTLKEEKKKNKERQHLSIFI